MKPKIASFITTTIRRPPTLPDSLESIRKAGFDPFIVQEPELPLETYGDLSIQVVQPARHGGPYGLLKLGLGLALQESDYVVAFQDDCRVATGAADWLASQINLVPTLKSCGAFSLYSAEALTESLILPGWHQVATGDLPRRAYGAVAIVFPAESARLMLANPVEYCPVERNRGKGLHADMSVGLHCLKSGRPWYFHYPSLVQHTGKVSVAYPNAPLNAFRMASEVVSDVSEISDWKAPKRKH